VAAAETEKAERCATGHLRAVTANDMRPLPAVKATPLRPGAVVCVRALQVPMRAVLEHLGGNTAALPGADAEMAPIDAMFRCCRPVQNLRMSEAHTVWLARVGFVA
jgi:hypothetical protein